MIANGDIVHIERAPRTSGGPVPLSTGPHLYPRAARAYDRV